MPTVETFSRRLTETFSEACHANNAVGRLDRIVGRLRLLTPPARNAVGPWPEVIHGDQGLVGLVVRVADVFPYPSAFVDVAVRIENWVVDRIAAPQLRVSSNPLDFAMN
jgi:hypothetical protein